MKRFVALGLILGILIALFLWSATIHFWWGNLFLGLVIAGLILKVGDDEKQHGNRKQAQDVQTHGSNGYHLEAEMPEVQGPVQGAERALPEAPPAWED